MEENKEKNNWKKVVLVVIVLIVVLAIGISIGFLFNRGNVNHNTGNTVEVTQVISDEFSKNKDYLTIYGKDSNGNAIWEYKTTEEKPKQIVNEGINLLTTRNNKVYVNEWGKLYILDMQTGKELYHTSDSDLSEYSSNMGTDPKFIFDENENLYTYSYLSFLQKYDEYGKLKGALDIGLYYSNEVEMNIKDKQLIITTSNSETIIIDLDNFLIISNTAIKNNTNVLDSNAIQNQTTVDSEYNTAVAEIKKCLKDENWLKQNIYIKNDEMIGDDCNIDDQQIKFIVCKSNIKPIIVVETSSDNARFIKIELITYENNSIKVERINQGHIYHNGYNIDANKGVVSTLFMHMGVYYSTLHSIVDGKVNLIGTYGYQEYIQEDINGSGSDEFLCKYYINNGTNSSSEKEVSEEDYKKYKKSLNEDQYSFVSITTELTNENIDKYIK